MTDSTAKQKAPADLPVVTLHWEVQEIPNSPVAAKNSLYQAVNFPFMPLVVVKGQLKGPKGPGGLVTPNGVQSKMGWIPMLGGQAMVPRVFDSLEEAQHFAAQYATSHVVHLLELLSEAQEIRNYMVELMNSMPTKLEEVDNVSEPGVADADTGS